MKLTLKEYIWLEFFKHSNLNLKSDYFRSYCDSKGKLITLEKQMVDLKAKLADESLKQMIERFPNLELDEFKREIFVNKENH